jgi:hypothetical protein
MADLSDTFAKAALVARDPDHFEGVDGLTEDERNALAYERDHKWHGPKMLWYSIGLCAVGAATQGWYVSVIGTALSISFLICV